MGYDYIRELIEVDKRIREWEVGKPEVAEYILKDRKRTEEWIERGNAIERIIFGSLLTQEDKAKMFGRVNTSYSFVNNKPTNNSSDESLISKYSPYLIGFVAGVYFTRTASEFSKKIEDGLANRITTIIEKELGEKLARSSNSQEHL